MEIYIALESAGGVIVAIPPVVIPPFFDNTLVHWVLWMLFFVQKTAPLTSILIEADTSLLGWH